MKRKTLGAIILAVCMLCTSLFSACAEIGDFFSDLFDNIGFHFHNYDNAWTSDETYHWHECLNSGCEEPVSGKASHVDRDEDGECDVCGHEVAPPHDHEYEWINNGDGTHKQHCTVVGCLSPIANEGKHYYDLEGKCECGAEAAVEGHTHTLTLVARKEATCIKAGNKAYYTCEGCAELFLDEAAQTKTVLEDLVLTALGHDMQSGVCSRCGNIDWEYGDINLIEVSNGTYGYDYLGTMTNGANRQALYRKIDEAVQEMHNDVISDLTDSVFAEISFNNMGLSASDALVVWKIYTDDNPLYYWFSNSVKYRSNEIGNKDNVLLLQVAEEYLKASVREKYHKLIYTQIKEFLKCAEKETSAYQIALAFHDEIITAIDYAFKKNNEPEDAKWAHSIAGVFEKRGAVCEGYAKAFQLLLNVRKINNVLVDGIGGSGAHAWNLIQLDDKQWYWCDLTWDDAPDYAWGIYYGYFCVNDKQIVKWSDGGEQTGNVTNGSLIGGSATSNNNFLTEHSYFKPNPPSSVQEINFLYELPDRSPHAYAGVQGELILRDTFEMGGIQYAVAGYGTVQVTKVPTSGDVVIPQTVSHDEQDYTVIAIGAIGSTKLFGAGYLFGSGVTSISLPGTIKYIWGWAFFRATVSEVTFNGTSEDWDKIGKANAWKNSNRPWTVHCDDKKITA